MVCPAATTTTTTNNIGKNKLSEISRNNTQRRAQFEELMEYTRSELIKLNLYIMNQMSQESHEHFGKNTWIEIV